VTPEICVGKPESIWPLRNGPYWYSVSWYGVPVEQSFKVNGIFKLINYFVFKLRQYRTFFELT